MIYARIRARKVYFFYVFRALHRYLWREISEIYSNFAGKVAVTAGKAGTKGKDHYITISDVFAGTATVAGSYYE